MPTLRCRTGAASPSPSMAPSWVSIAQALSPSAACSLARTVGGSNRPWNRPGRLHAQVVEPLPSVAQQDAAVVRLRVQDGAEQHLLVVAGQQGGVEATPAPLVDGVARRADRAHAVGAAVGEVAE